MPGIEFLLFVILHTDRAASHGHDIVIKRYSTETQCVSAGDQAIKKDSRDHYVCVPVTALPKAK